MALIEKINISEAPDAPKKQSAYATELLNAIGSLKKNEVLRVTADEDKSIRGLKTGIGRITKGAGVKVTTWDDEVHVYLAKA